MPRFADPLQTTDIINPFPGIVALERMLGRAITARIGSNEGLPIANEALLHAFGASFCELARLYPDPSALALRECVAAQQRVQAEQVLFDAGADSLLLLALRSFCNAGDAVVTSAGTYPSFKYFAEGVGARIIEVPYHDQAGLLAPNLSTMAAEATACNAKVVYLANPDNPSGYYHDRNAIRRFREQLPIETALILDEAYIDFCGVEECLALAGHGNVAIDYPNTVRLRTLSKAYAAAGLRLGYALADAEWIKKAAMIRIHYATSSVAQAAGLILLNDERYKQQLIAQTLQLRQQLTEQLSAAGNGRITVLPSATNFIAIRYSDAARATAVQQQLWQQGISVHRPPHPALQHLLRVTAQPAALEATVISTLAGG
ncbi:aminotransferase class I/II-fold pyridoxal phosphate-dependent enzyme [Permianibacter sp. IMCC34836]|uniref:aminotransferase class I/II-fold pyridoxal phosphate-dependent enzyme n=1 Tax=Permianibacter fluminis TaxID=2738515 RepID=UPI00155783D4|nr:aminotransferase class I/II-fold pyridoxal phosphate-dependent enzyme [Permianibacter fluminis]NQD38091.1 aminotransferase class I/II-fold pyridoxal phosphate-dependent enzyme [Permianibacter fluminis]